MYVKWILIRYAFGKLTRITAAIWNHKCNPKPKQRIVHCMIQSIEPTVNSILFYVWFINEHHNKNHEIKVQLNVLLQKI